MADKLDKIHPKHSSKVAPPPTCKRLHLKHLIIKNENKCCSLVSLQELSVTLHVERKKIPESGDAKGEGRS